MHVQPAEEQFVVETLAGEARALGTRFYVRTYAVEEEAMKGLESFGFVRAAELKDYIMDPEENIFDAVEGTIR